jgi:hypothetical protein
MMWIVRVFGVLSALVIVYGIFARNDDLITAGVLNLVLWSGVSYSAPKKDNGATVPPETASTEQ